MTMTLVSTVVVGTDNPQQIEWTGIPQTGKDLLILISGRATNFNGNVTLNGSTSTYTTRELYGSGSSANWSNASHSAYFITTLYEPRDFNGTDNTISHFGNSSIYISNYTASGVKSLSSESVMEFNSSESYLAFTAGTSPSVGAVTSVQLKVSGSGTFNQYSSASLYIIS